MIIKNQEGLQFLSGLPDESVDLVLTDPPYITSRKSGMDKWVDHVAEQDAAGTNLKSEQAWEKFNAGMDWDKFFDPHSFKMVGENAGGYDKMVNIEDPIVKALPVWMPAVERRPFAQVH